MLMLKHIILASSILALSATASANLTFKAGIGHLDPTATKDIANNLPNAKISGESALLPSFDYRFGNSPFSAELLLATPFEHSVQISTADTNPSEVATFKHLPPTITFKYNSPEFRGFGANVGLGATVLVPFEEKLHVAPNGKFEADTVVAPTAQIGVTFSKPNSPWGLFADVRYVNLKTDLKLDGQKVGELTVNPMVYAIGVSHKF